LRFELIDRVLERQADRLTAMKMVSHAEEYLADHFPGFAVLPGVMMLETLAQAARLLVGEGDDPRVIALVLSEVRNLKYGNMVRPGQALTVEVTLRQRHEDGSFEFQGVGKVAEQIAVQGRFRLAPLEQFEL
jgi:3-hydroxyacyl-[acyl-carrier-protein] dehydratase